jgi:phage shock protein E
MDTKILWILTLTVAVIYVTLRRITRRKAQSSVIQQKIAQGAIIIDVRTPSEYATRSFPKAKNIPLDALASRLGELSKTRPIILYCASGARATQAAGILTRAGFTDVVNAGGIADMLATGSGSK